MEDKIRRAVYEVSMDELHFRGKLADLKAFLKAFFTIIFFIYFFFGFFILNFID